MFEKKYVRVTIGNFRGATSDSPVICCTEVLELVATVRKLAKDFFKTNYRLCVFCFRTQNGLNVRLIYLVRIWRTWN